MRIGYIRWVIKGKRGGDTYMHLAEFLAAGCEFSAVSGTVDGAAMQYPNNVQTIDKIIDGEAEPTACFVSPNGHAEITLTLANPVEKITEYGYITGGDAPARDPVTWTLYVSENGADWYCVDVRNNADVSAERGATVLFAVGNLWYIEENAPYRDEFPEILTAMSEPFPAVLWRIDSGVNDGLPYHVILPDIQGVDIWSLTRERRIYIYDKSEPQTGFKSNGLAILEPISCTSWHDADRWDVELVHPLDDWGKWKFLQCENVLKIGGQLFRVDRYTPKISGTERTVSVHASHITTDLAARLIADSQFSGGTPAQFIDFAFSSVQKPLFDEGLTEYKFEGYSDISANLAADEYINTSLWAAIVGADNSLIARAGGELYRDNFYISVCSRMQYARDNAFRLRYTLDMTEISQNIDYSGFATELHCRDNWGNYFAVSWVGLQFAIHHPRVRAAQFSYSEYEGSMERLIADTYAIWRTMDYPSVTYELTIANLRNDARYADFLALQDYDYGDAGEIYCPELDISTEQKITAVQRDELTGDILRMTLGNLRESWARPSLMAGVTSGRSAADKQVKAMQSVLMGTSIAGMQDYTINAAQARKIAVLQGD